MLRIQNLERCKMGGEPFPVMRLHRLGRADDAHPFVGRCWLQREKADRAEPADKMIDLPVAGEAIKLDRLLQPPDGEPGVPARRILGSFQPTAE